MTHARNMHFADFQFTIFAFIFFSIGLSFCDANIRDICFSWNLDVDDSFVILSFIQFSE